MFSHSMLEREDWAKCKTILKSCQRLIVLEKIVLKAFSCLTYFHDHNFTDTAPIELKLSR